MEIQLNFDANQAIKNLTQAGIDEEQATALVSTFGNFSNNIATKDDLEVVKQGLTGLAQEINAMEARQSQRSDHLEKSLMQEMGAMKTSQSQKDDYLAKTIAQEISAMEERLIHEMGAMKTSQFQKDDYLEKTLTQEMGTIDIRQSQRSDYLEKNLTNEIAKSRYMMFAAIVAGMIAVVGLYNVLGKFLN